MNPDGRYAWRTRYADAWAEFRGSREITSAEAVDQAISAAIGERVERVGIFRGFSLSTVKTWRVGGNTALTVPGTEEISAAVASVLEAPDLHQMWLAWRAGGFGAELTEVVPSPRPAASESEDGSRPDPTPPGASSSSSSGAVGGPASDRARERGPRRPSVGFRTVAVVATAAVVVALAAGLGAASLRAHPPDTAGPTPPVPPATDVPVGCDAGVAVGQLDRDLGPSSQAPEWTRQLKRAFDDAGDRAGCVTAPARRFGDLIYQDVARVGVPNGAVIVVADDPSRAWWFNRPLWGSYHQLVEKTSVFVGLPVELAAFPDGHVEMTTSTGGVLVAERDDAPYFLVASFHAGWWRAHPELGLPTRQPDAPAGRQDFQHGYGTVTDAKLLEPEAHLVSDPAGELPGGELSGHILEQGDHTSWWIPAPGKRQWIPDQRTWACLGGESKLLAPRGVAGYAVATLAYDGVASCS